jgi:hypothetical protein
MKKADFWYMFKQPPRELIVIISFFSYEDLDNTKEIPKMNIPD